LVANKFGKKYMIRAPMNSPARNAGREDFSPSLWFLLRRLAAFFELLRDIDCCLRFNGIVIGIYTVKQKLSLPLG
jgi:hypothetical protein